MSSPSAAPENGSHSNGDGDDTAAVAAAAAAAEAAAAHAVPFSTSGNPELDTTHLSNLPTEQQELTLLQFAAQLSRHVNSLTEDDCTAQQYYLKKEVFKVMHLTTPYPSRVVRNTLGRCLAYVFSKGDRKLLFETINDLNAVVTNSGKTKADGSGESRTKQAAVVCLGEVFGAAGDSAISLHQVTSSTLIKVLKGSQNHAGMRAAVFGALAKLVRCLGPSCDESVARDMWKQARNHAPTDKGALVAVMACRCLTALVRHTGYFDAASDFESLCKTVFKTIDAPSSHVRRAATDCLVEGMVRGYAESFSSGDGGGGGGKGSRKMPRPKSLKRASTLPSVLQDEDGLPGSRSSSPGPGASSSTTSGGRSVLSLPLVDMLKTLSTHYVRLSTSNRARAALGVAYGRVLQRLGEKAVEQSYLAILDNLTVDLLGHSTVANNRYRLLVARRIVDTVLQDIVGRRILSEAGQVAAAKTLINAVFKERAEPGKYTLVAALGALGALIESLGSAANNVAESCRDGLLQLLPHPSYSVQVQAAACLKAFVLACPQQLLPCLSVCMNSLAREMGQLGSGGSSSSTQQRRCLGFAHGLAATLSASPLRPLYGSVEINSRVLTLATNLLKTSGQSDLRIASAQIQVAYVLLGGLMALGPNFVKIHLPQMLLLWKNALPKPLSKDNVASRTLLETTFLTHIRNCALGSILAFLQFNSRLLTVDVSKRIAAMLQNTAAFLKTLPARKTTDDPAQRLVSPALQLAEIDVLVQRRLLQCYLRLINLAPAGSSEALLQSSNLLTLVVSQFADPDHDSSGGSGGSLSASIATAAGAFETIWEVGDNAGFGVTGLVKGFHVRGLPGEHETGGSGTERDQQQQLESLGEMAGPEGNIERLLLSPVCGAMEHDAGLLYSSPEASLAAAGALLPDPAATEVVNVAIQLFAYVFPLTVSKVQESILEQIATFLSASSLQRDPGRRAAMKVNVAAAMLLTLKVAVRETTAAPGDVSNAAVERLLQDLVGGFVIDADPYVRNLGYAAMGRLCNACGHAFTSQAIRQLVDTIVVNREPSARAGSAMALGCIEATVGGMAAGYHLKTVLGVLMSLCNDPQPTVHFWALEAFAEAAGAAGLSFAGYVSSSLGMLARLYGSEDHGGEGPSAASMNLELERSTPAAIARCVDALINVLGPDLQESTRTRELILALVRLFEEEGIVGGGEEEEKQKQITEGGEAEEDFGNSGQVRRAGLSCLEHLSLYAPGHVAFATYVRLLQGFLPATDPALRDAAIDGLYNLMKRDADEVVAAAAPGLEDQLWLVLDRQPAHDGLRTLLRNWLRQTGLTATAVWLQRFQHVLRMTRAKVPETTRLVSGRGGGWGAGGGGSGGIDLQDEEVAGLGSAETTGESATEAGGTGGTAAVGVVSSAEVEPLRWQVSAFVLSLLNELFLLVGQDAALGSVGMGGDPTPAQTALQARVADVVRMAFSASTSGVLEQRVWGLKIIGAVLRMFGRTADPDFEEAMLLEQYQAQISSALTPAFAADSSPELAAEAVHVCAAFVATGIVTDVDRMGRILKTLIGALDSFADSNAHAVGTTTGGHTETAAIGDLRGLSANAQVMVRMAVFAAWAELQVASLEQRYLVDVLRPHLGRLTPLWLESLREFARLRFEPDISLTLGPPSLSGSLDTIYAALNRETLLAFYQDAWLKLVDAIASLIEQDSEFVFDALDGRLAVDGQPATPVSSTPQGADINYRDEPVAFFFVLFGIAFEALAARQGQADSLAAPGQTLAILLALKKILHPSVSGQAIYREAVFSETMDLLDRLVLTEGLDVQTVIVDIARALCLAHPAARTRDDAEPGELSDDIEQLFELTRIMVLVLSGLLPSLGETPGQSSPSQQHPSTPRYHMTEEAVLLLVRTALDALVDAAEVFPAVIRTDLHACLVHIFATILATPACQEVVMPQALPTLKRFIATAATEAVAASPDALVARQTQTQMRGCLRRFLSIYLQAQKREAPTSLTCVKNCLLAITILFTAGHNGMSTADPLVVKYLDELLDCLTDRMTAKIAANCCRSLLLHNHTTAADQSIGRYLLPRLLAFVANATPADPEHARSMVAQTLSAFVVGKSKAAAAAGGDPHTSVSVAMALVIPALLARAAGELKKGAEDEEGETDNSTAMYRETSGRLLELASADPTAFRGVVAGLGENQRSFMEGVIKAGRQPETSKTTSTTNGQPTIALKMNFGN